VTRSSRPSNQRSKYSGANNQAADEVTTEVATEVATEVKRLLKVLRGVMKRQDLQEATGLKNDSHFRKKYLIPAIEAGVVAMTIPEKPNSRLQQYRITAKGQKLLEKMTH
jgi:ATP-dependent DNA helicase RecG